MSDSTTSRSGRPGGSNNNGRPRGNSGSVFTFGAEFNQSLEEAGSTSNDAPAFRFGSQWTESLNEMRPPSNVPIVPPRATSPLFGQHDFGQPTPFRFGSKSPAGSPSAPSAPAVAGSPSISINPPADQTTTTSQKSFVFGDSASQHGTSSSVLTGVAEKSNTFKPQVSTPTKTPTKQASTERNEPGPKTLFGSGGSPSPSAQIPSPQGLFGANSDSRFVPVFGAGPVSPNAIPTRPNASPSLKPSSASSPGTELGHRRIARPRSRTGRESSGSTPNNKGLLFATPEAKSEGPTFVFSPPPFTPDNVPKSQSPGEASTPQFLAASPSLSPSVPSPGRESPSADSMSGKPYDVAVEEVPDHLLFSRGTQKKLQDAGGIAQRVTESIKQIPSMMKDDYLQNILTDAERLCKFQPSTAKTIAILGDSGEGKSSLINSLLHTPGIAKTSDSGSACTSVVTEYWQKATHHTAPITIEVDYLSASEIEGMVTELLWSYRKFYHPSTQSPETSAEEFQKFQRESDVAWSALEAAFQHNRGFSEANLQDQSEGAEERLRTKLVEWSRGIEWPAGSADGRWMGTASNAKECSSQINVFSSDKHWPFTKVIRVYIDAHVLKSGVVLTDLPGLHDTNLARVKATQDYLMKCDNIFIVSKISRAITDQSLKSSLFAVLSRNMPTEWDVSTGKNLKIAVICTKSEDINIDSARDTFSGKGKSIPRATIDQLDKDIEKAEAADNYPLKKQLKSRRQALFIKARNEHVKNGLRSAYSSKISDKTLEVFCVSNKLYDKQCKKGDLDLISLSGIPSLRRFCRLIGADAQLAAGRHYVNSAIPGLVISLKLWATRVNMSQEEESIASRTMSAVQQEWQRLRNSLSHQIMRLVVSFNTCFRDQIMAMAESQYGKWTEAAEIEAQRWAQKPWHHTQYNAWCHRNGYHVTAKRDEDWNAKIIWKMRLELDFQWDILEDEVPDIFKTLLDSVKRLVGPLREILKSGLDDEMFNLINAGVDSKLQSFEYKLGLLQDKLASEVKLTRRYASESNMTSFVLNEMKSSYRQASDQHGTGRWERQKAIINGRISDQVLFPSICIAMQNRQRSVIEESKTAIQAIVGDLVNQMKADIESGLARTLGLEVKRAEAAKDQVKKMLSDIEHLKRTAAGLAMSS